MSKKTRYLLGILLTIIIGTILYWFFCCQYCSNNGKHNHKKHHLKTNDVVKPTVTKTPFLVNDPNGNFNIETNSSFNFKTSDYHVIKPLSPNLEDGLNNLAKYFSSNPEKHLLITGVYKEEEENHSAFPNLGLARANAVKNLIASRGVNYKNITTNSQLDNSLTADVSSVLYGPLNFNITTKDQQVTVNTKELEDQLKAIKADPLILYFDTAQVAIELTASQRQKVANMVDYLTKVDQSHIVITGHTDNEGSRETNIKVGQGRADFAKNYLMDNGIPENKIISTSVGPDQPIADNTTEEGKAKNRRVVVTIN